MRRWLARRAGALAIGQTIAKAAPIAGALVLVRTLPAGDWESLALILTFYLAGQSLGTLGLQHGIVFFAGRLPPDRHRGLIVQTAALLLAAGAVTGGLVIAAAPLVGKGQVDVSRWLPAIAFVLVVEAPCACAPPALIALERPERAALWEGGFAAIQLAGLLGAVIAGLGVDGAVGALVVCAILRAAAFVLLVRAGVPPGPIRFERSLLGDHVIYTLPLGLSLAAGAINQAVDKWLVAALDPDAFGSYAVAAQEIPLLSVAPYAVGAALVTRMTAAFRDLDTRRAHELWLVQTSSMSLVVVPIVVGVILVSSELIELLFTHEHVAAILPFQIFTVVALHRVAEYGLVLRAAGRGRDLLAASLLLLGANALFGAVLTAVYGMVGASVATLIANVIAWVFVLGRLAGIMDVPLSRVFPWRIYVRSLVISTGIALIVHLIVSALPLVLGARLVVAAGLYAGGWFAASFAKSSRR